MVDSTVWFADRRVRGGYSMLDKLERLWRHSGIAESIKEGHRVIIKTHFGQLGNLLYLRPSLLRRVVDLVKEQGGLPVLAESAGLGYGVGGLYGGRTTAPEYLRMAASHGFTMGSMGAPLVLLDGYWGTETFTVPIQGRHLKRVEVGMGLRDADLVVVVSHFKGHGITGIGGALKNLGLGCVGKYSKAMVHGPKGLQVDPERCLGERCAQPCLRVCPARCISLEGGLSVDLERCLLCAHCASVCRREGSEALRMAWDEGVEGQTERMVENALGVLEGVGRNRFLFINVALDISEVCDCVSWAPQPIVPDLGLLVSRDPVAVDQACLDLATKAPALPASTCQGLGAGEDKFAQACGQPDPKTGKVIPTRTHLLQLEYAEKMGLGSRTYRLVHVDPPESPDK